MPRSRPNDRAISGDAVAVRLGPLAQGLLMTLGTLGQLALNIVLPSLPAIGRELETAPGAERLVLSVFLVGFAGGQLLVGPFSDRFGRRAILIPGLALYAALGLVAIFTASLEWLLAARLVQGLGAAAGFVVARAIARDVFEGAALIRILGLLTLTMGIVPGVAPILGGLIEDAAGWQANIAVTAVVGTAMLILCFVALPETASRSEQGLTTGRIAVGYTRIVKERTFRRFAFTNALTLGSLYAFHAGAPELMIEKLGLTPSEFGIVALAHSGTYMLGAAAVTRFSARVTSPPMVMTSSALAMCTMAAVMLWLGLSGFATVVNVTACMMVFTFNLGVILPLGVASALEPFKAQAGSATAMLGALQMAAGALASAAVAAFDDIPEIVFPSVMIVMTVAAAINAFRK